MGVDYVWISYLWLVDPAIDGDPLQPDVEQVALAPDPAIDGDPLQSDVERALDPYDPFADAPYAPGQEAHDPISDSPYDTRRLIGATSKNCLIS